MAVKLRTFSEPDNHEGISTLTPQRWQKISLVLYVLKLDNWPVTTGGTINQAPVFGGIFFSILDKAEYIYNTESPELRKRYQIDHVKTCHGSVLYGRRRFEDTNRHGELKLNEVLMCDYNEEL